MKTNPKNTPQSRADELWQRFVGLFGGESVKRKFGDDPPDEWVGVLAQLSDYQLERGMRRLLRSGKSTPPSCLNSRSCVARSATMSWTNLSSQRLRRRIRGRAMTGQRQRIVICSVTCCGKRASAFITTREVPR